MIVFAADVWQICGRIFYLDRLANLPDRRSFNFQLNDNPALSDEYEARVRAEFSGL